MITFHCLILALFLFSSSMLRAQIDYDERNGMFVNFDDDDYGWFRWDCASPNTAQISVADNPDPYGINTSDKVGQYVTSSCTYEGAACTARFKYVDFSEKSIFKIKVYAPDSDMIFLLKLEDYDNNDIFFEVGASTTTYNEWEELVFDFSGALSGAYQRIAVLPDFGGEYEYYWYFDDIRLTDLEDTKTDDSAHIVQTYRLSQNYPNPFNPTTAIHYAVPKLTQVQINIYDTSGRLISSLLNEKQSGANSVSWNGCNQQGQLSASGVYFCSLHADGELLFLKKMILIR